METEKKYWTSFNYLEFQLTGETVNDCSHQGQCYDDCKYWQQQLNLNLNREKMILELKDYGSWSEQELNELDDSELEIKLIWLGANDISENELFEKEVRT